MRTCPIVSTLVALAIFSGCKNSTPQEQSPENRVKTPVTITSTEFKAISETVRLNATSTFLRKNEIKAPVTGYVEKVYVNIGDQVKAGSLLFQIKTKEAEALSLLPVDDSLMKIKGEVSIAAPASGIITGIPAQAKMYVNDGDPLASMADGSSFVFIVHVPFEFRSFIVRGKDCKITLPDSTQIAGNIGSSLSEIDPVSQTQSFIIKTQTYSFYPENLIVTVEFNKRTSPNAQIVDKSCVLSDEIMENFWVMKLINDTTAIKIPVSTGIISGNRIEITKPIFKTDDRLINSGHYGLQDTAGIVIMK